MKRFQWAIAIVLITGAHCVYADSVPLNLTGASIVIFPNLSGDNTSFAFIGPGVSISGSGSAVCDAWCNGQLLPPGSRLSPNVDLLGFCCSQGTVSIGGRTENVGSLFNSSISASSFIFPTHGQKTFTISVFGFIPGITGRTQSGEFFNLEMPRGGRLTLTFDFNSFDDGYHFSKGRFTAGVVPEPGTLGLMGSGLAAIIGAGLRNRRSKRTLADGLTSSSKPEPDRVRI